MPPAEFEPVILSSERPQTHASDCAAALIGVCHTVNIMICLVVVIRALRVFLHFETTSAPLTRNYRDFGVINYRQFVKQQSVTHYCTDLLILLGTGACSVHSNRWLLEPDSVTGDEICE